MGSERPNFGSEQPNSLPDFKLKFYKRQIYSFAFLGSEFFCPQPKCKCVVVSVYLTLYLALDLMLNLPYIGHGQRL